MIASESAHKQGEFSVRDLLQIEVSGYQRYHASIDLPLSYAYLILFAQEKIYEQARSRRRDEFDDDDDGCFSRYGIRRLTKDIRELIFMLIAVARILCTNGDSELANFGSI